MSIPAGSYERALTAMTALSQEQQLRVIGEVLRSNRYGDCDIDVTPFRERFLIRRVRDGLGAAQVAEAMGWFYGKGADAKGDGTRLQRRLGLMAEVSSRGLFTVRRFVSYRDAVALCDVLDMDYTEVGV
jgi:nucleoside phosphorylase